MAAPRNNEVLNEILKYSMRSKKAPCKVGLALDQLDKGARDDLDPLIADAKYPPGAFEQFFTARDIVGVTIPAIQSHRKKTCSCHD